VLDKVVAGIVPNVDPEGKMRLRFHGQVPTRLARTPHYLYAMLLRTRPSGFIEPCLPSPAERPPSGPGDEAGIR
jgi:hypothetical protein